MSPVVGDMGVARSATSRYSGASSRNGSENDQANPPVQWRRNHRLRGEADLLGYRGVTLVFICWQLLDTWLQRKRSRNWPTLSAVIDIASVAFMEDDDPLPGMAGSNHHYYLATLTYVWRNPELQMGEYRRSFANEDDARAWANSYKGETVTIHVDPRDPTRSVLRQEDL